LSARQVRVVGPSGLVRDAVQRSLTAGGLQIAEEVDSDASGIDVVAVLVQPTPDQWRVARTADNHIVVVSDSEAMRFSRARWPGADVVISTEASSAALQETVWRIVLGHPLPESSSVQEVKRFSGLAEDISVALTPRESEILAAIATGKSVKQTARLLGIAPKTVENLQSKLFRKLDARNRAQAVKRGYELGLLGKSSARQSQPIIDLRDLG
jgi:DNA-binding NarL/FixJ family response regulator